jgi:aromatic ring-cleaving dioxygenase
LTEPIGIRAPFRLISRTMNATLVDPIREYDAHIYYDLESREAAIALREKALREFAGEEVRVKAAVDRPIGPHPQPMFELNFPARYHQRIVEWLGRERSGLDVLVHKVTGFDRHDHTDGIIWLGTPVPLDFATFET